MFDRLRTQVLRVLRVPPDPEPPVGASGSLRVFRAGRNLYKWRLLRWTLGQSGALLGIAASVIFLDRFEKGYADARAGPNQPIAVQTSAATPVTPLTAPPTNAAPVAAAGENAPKPASGKKRLPPEAKKRAPASLTRAVERSPWWLFPLLKFLEFAGILTFLAQIPLTYALVRLDYELRWYLVTDRSLRIRAGVATVQESTMSFANVQQVVVTQGPVQRLLGIADVRVQSAGGGGDSQDKGAQDSLHTGVFHGVENASEIRDLILERLRRFRESGLGDPDEPPPAPEAAELAPPPPGAALAAAREVLAEVRALRRLLA